MPDRSRKSGSRGAFKNTVYALLCVAVAGLIVWLFRPPKPASKLAAVQPAAPVVAAKIPLPTNAPILPVTQPLPTTAVSRPAAIPTASTLALQIALVRQGISPGSIDGVAGGQTRSALLAFQRKKGLTPSGSLNDETKEALDMTSPDTTEYTITSNDLARLLPVPKTWLEKSQLPRLDFETIAELLGEKAYCSPILVRKLNPNIDWSNVVAGAVVTLPNVQYPPAGRAALIRISLDERMLEAFDDSSNLLVHFPCSIGRLAEKRPVGELHVAKVAFDPNYTFDPAVFPESPEAQQLGHKLIIPPGPNNPVGVAWIGLDRPGYGIHGTPSPEQVGRTESHGCFRLANWNADYLAHMVWIGMPVVVEGGQAAAAAGE